MVVADGDRAVVVVVPVVDGVAGRVVVVGVVADGGAGAGPVVVDVGVGREGATAGGTVVAGAGAFPVPEGELAGAGRTRTYSTSAPRKTAPSTTVDARSRRRLTASRSGGLPRARSGP